jgi:uroporphyrinogen-III synthase
LAHNLHINDVDFLQLEYLPNAFSLATLDAPLVFTSAHAVAAFERIIGSGARFTCYSIGGNTNMRALQAGFHVLAHAQHGEALARLIAEKREKKVIHLCGDMRRPELHETLAAAGVLVQEIVVYTKLLQPKKVENFDAVMFFSPSQVDAFLQANQLPDSIPAICVGNTTANHLKTKGFAHVIVAQNPDEESVIQAVIGYFNSKT